MINLTRKRPPKRQWRISIAMPDNYPVLAAIHADCFNHGWSEDELASTLATTGTSCYVANLSGSGTAYPRGFLIIRTLSEQSEILTLAVDPNFRNQQVATALMSHAIRQLQADRVSNLFLEVSEANAPALKLYRSLNFRKISVRKSYYANASAEGIGTGSLKSNALVMQLELG